jgi:Mlc titration factor MtfA (ptsG expression regulator)
MFFSWLRDRRRKKLLTEPFPDEWLDYLRRNVPHYRTLTDEEQTRLRDNLRIFAAEKEWEGCGALELTDEIKVTVSGFACLLTLGLPGKYFERVPAILVYPGAYVVPDRPVDTGLLVEDQELEGEAHYRGPVVLNWAELQADALAPQLGKNLVFHEFAHQLDMLNGEADGVPLLPDATRYEWWQQVMSHEFRRLGRAVDRGEPTLLDGYGAEHESEFFAVTTECFFNLPLDLREQHSELYELFVSFYRQDPASRPAPWA